MVIIRIQVLKDEKVVRTKTIKYKNRLDTALDFFEYLRSKVEWEVEWRR